MPDIVRLRYLGEETVNVAVLGRAVEPDCLVDFAGKVLEDNEDHYVIEAPGGVRNWPKSRWLDETVSAKPDKE